MIFVVVTDLYNGIYKVLANDEIILNYLGIGTSATNLEKATQIQKRAKPQDLVEDNLPIIGFYTPGGQREQRNVFVYTCPFVFDVYTQDDVALAQNVVERITELFSGEINKFIGVENFQGELVTAHESSTDLDNCYCFTVVVNMSVSLDK